MAIATLGIDLGKNLNSVVGLDATGRVVLRRRVRRATLKELAANLPACVVAMEACCGAHHVGRLFAAQGHTVRLPPQSLSRILRREGFSRQKTRPTHPKTDEQAQRRFEKGGSSRRWRPPPRPIPASG